MVWLIQKEYLFDFLIKTLMFISTKRMILNQRKYDNLYIQRGMLQIERAIYATWENKFTHN